MITLEKLEAAIRYAELCEIAYLDEAEARAKMPGVVCDLVEDKVTDTQAYLIEIGKELIVVFRGTEFDKAQDVLTDLRCKLVAHPFGTVHEGFYASLGTIRERLLDRLFAMHAGHKIVITGHSLGGALAMLFATELKETLAISGVEIFTFGQPRVGCVRFAGGFKERYPSYFRFVNDMDGVPKVPSSIWQGYRHSHEFLFINRDFVVEMKLEGHQWADNLAYLLSKLFANSKSREAILKHMEAFGREQGDDHRISSYISALRAAKSRLIQATQDPPAASALSKAEALP